MKKLLVFFALAAVTLFAELEEFGTNYEKALKEAQKSKKDVYMLVTSDYCRWCRKFENETLSNDSLIDHLQEKFVLLYIQRGRDVLPDSFEVKKVPKHYFLRSDGEVIHSVLGYWNAEDFRSFVKDAQMRKERMNK